MQNQIDTSKAPNEVAIDELRKSAISVAAEWLSVHREECGEPIIPWIRDRFDLTNKEAIEALRRCNALRSARAL